MVETVVITSEPTDQAPEGHDQKMVEAVDKAAEIPKDDLTPPETRPDWLPEKFKSAEDMAKAYQALESKLGSGNKEEPKADTKSAEAITSENATTENAQEQLSKAGLNLDEFSAEFASKGELSPESYEKLQKAGFDQNLVNDYIEGQRARAAQFESGIKAEVGGDDKFNEMVNWAKANLTESEIVAYNKAVGSANADTAKLAVLGLSAKFNAANGSEPQRTLGGNQASGSDVFESTAQVTEAMKDPRYKNDPAFRAKVQSKLGRSNVF